MTCTWCDEPVFDGVTAHACCELHQRKDCPACAASRDAEKEWMRVSSVCSRCKRRSRFSTEFCPPCTRAIEDVITQDQEKNE